MHEMSILRPRYSNASGSVDGMCVKACTKAPLSAFGRPEWAQHLQSKGAVRSLIANHSRRKFNQGLYGGTNPGDRRARGFALGNEGRICGYCGPFGFGQVNSLL